MLGTGSNHPNSSPPEQPLATTSTTLAQPWAHEAVGFFDALSRFHPDEAEAFYAPAASIDGAGFTPDIEGIAGIREYRETSYLWGESVRHVFLARDRAIVDMPIDDWPYDELRAIDMRGDRIAHETRGDRIQHWAEKASTARSAQKLQALYAAYLSAWESGDRAQIAAVYEPDAVATDGLFGGPIRSGSPPDPQSREPDTLLGTGTRYRPVNAATIVGAQAIRTEPRSAVPTLYAPRPPASPSDLEQGTHLPVAYAVFEVVTGDGCELRLAAEWELTDDRIASEELFYETTRLRRCLEKLDLRPPEGWWTGLAPPDPLAETVTDRVTTWDGALVEIINGSPAQHHLAEWALERFETAELPAPQVATIAFPPTRLCADTSDGAFALVHPTAARVDVCLSEHQICSDARCEAISPYAARTLLHELGHVWEHQYVDDPTRQSFLDLRGLAAWSALDVKWHERGNEQVAEAIAWGLMEYPIITMIPDANPGELAAGFHLITGTEPLHLP